MPVSIFRSPHDPNELNKTFRGLFENCDIFFSEQGFNDDYDLIKRHLSELSNNGYSTVSMEEAYFDAYSKELENIIRNSKKKIEIEKSPFNYEDLEEINTLFYNARNSFSAGNANEAYTNMVKYSVEAKKRDERREEEIEKQLIDLQKIDKDKNILVGLGANHLIFYKLKKKGLDVKQEFSYKPFIFPIHIEIKRRIAFNKPFTEEMINKSIVESFIIQYLLESDASAKEVSEKPRRIVEKLNYEKIKELSKYISGDILRRQFPNESVVVWLRKQEIEI